MKRTVTVLDTTEKLVQANNLDRMKAAVDYRFTTYDGVMTNTYKALAFLAQGDKADARVEFNRAEDRQRRAEEEFQQEAAKNRQGQGAEFNQLMQQAQSNPDYQKAEQHLGAIAAYAPFQNPFATYLAGIFSVTNGDFDRGVNRLSRAAVILGPQSPAAADLAWVETQQRNGIVELPPQVWVVFENGQSATYAEMRLVLPMITGAPMTLALPVLMQNPPAAPFITAQTKTDAAQTKPAGSFDAVMAAEFNRRQPEIMAEAIVEIVAKNAAAKAAQNSNNQFVGLLANVAANVSTADTRSWLALPKEFQVARITTPADGHVQLTDANGRPLGTAVVPAGKSAIVFVKMQAPGAPPAVQVSPL